jgi:hypothetical protein
MAPRFSFLAAILLSLPAALLIAGTAISSRPEEVSLPPAPESPLAVIAALEKAWRAGDSEAVLACVSADAVELALDREGPPGGRFARAQAEFLIRDLLHYGETVEFKVTAFEWKAEALPQARAAWVHRMASGETQCEMDLVLAPEAGSWRVVRIAAR